MKWRKLNRESLPNCDCLLMDKTGYMLGIGNPTYDYSLDQIYWYIKIEDLKSLKKDESSI